MDIDGRVNYVDIKVTMWQRLYFSDDTDMNKIAQRIKSEEKSPNGFGEEDGLIAMKELYETDKLMTLEENNYNATIEVFQNNTFLWDNKPEPINSIPDGEA